jgi:sugar phosphate isomerase/epimerase
MDRKRIAHMKVGLFTVILRDLSLDHALDYLARLGVHTVEIGCGAYPGTDHCDPDALIKSSRRLKDFRNAFESRDMSISSLSVHGNPLHPNRKVAGADDLAFQKTLKLAERLGVEVVTTFSGCPGGGPRDRTPNWVTCAWPPDYLEILEYQWEQVAIPYWKKAVTRAASHGIRKIALEMHPGFIVYNPETMLKLRKAAGSALGANFDPSHLFWQGIDPCAAVRALKGALWHVHAKDTAIDKDNCSVNGVLDTKHYSDEWNRSWIFRTVGYGNSRQFWCDFVSALRLVGYDGALSIEHEDSLMTAQEGLEKAVKFLQDVVLHQPKGKVAWA